MFLTAANSAAAARLPTKPVAGVMFWAVWNSITAALVIDPKNPVAGTV